MLENGSESGSYYQIMVLIATFFTLMMYTLVDCLASEALSHYVSKSFLIYSETIFCNIDLFNFLIKKEIFFLE